MALCELHCMLVALMHEVVMEGLPPALSGPAWTLHDIVRDALLGARSQA